MIDDFEFPSILIVDDDPLFLATCTDSLAGKNFKVSTVRGAEDALIFLNNAHFDLVLSDIVMEGMSGMELLRTIKNEYPETDVVFTTGNADIQTATEAIQLGAYDYITKPVDFGELHWRIDKALERGRLKKVERDHRNMLKQQIREQGDRLRYLFFGAIEALVNAIEAKDPYTKGHSLRVTEYSVAFSKALNLSFEEATNIHLAARLHDIGKLATSEVILNKPGKLTEEEFAIIISHPVTGCDIMGPILEDEVLDIIRHHHEKWDGKGYPDGLAGEDIPLGARIVCLADCFDAMTSQRSYSPALELTSAYVEIEKFAGEKFDPRLASEFIEVMKRQLDGKTGPAILKDVSST